MSIQYGHKQFTPRWNGIDFYITLFKIDSSVIFMALSTKKKRNGKEHL